MFYFKLVKANIPFTSYSGLIKFSLMEKSHNRPIPTLRIVWIPGIPVISTAKIRLKVEKLINFCFIVEITGIPGIQEISKSRGFLLNTIKYNRKC